MTGVAVRRPDVTANRTGSGGALVISSVACHRHRANLGGLAAHLDLDLTRVEGCKHVGEQIGINGAVVASIEHRTLGRVFRQRMRCGHRDRTAHSCPYDDKTSRHPSGFEAK